MAEPLSTDLRKRVVDAVNGGMSRRQAVAHFKVGASSAIRWVAQSLATGDVTPKRQGGDRRSMAIEAQAVFILSLLGPQGDATLAEMRGVLLAAGHSFSISALSRFFARRGVTLEKVGARDRARSARYPGSAVGLGSMPLILIRRSSFSSTRPGPPRTWREDAVALPKGNACAPRSLTAIGKRRLSWPHEARRNCRRTVFHGPINAQVFQAYVEQFLARRCGRATLSSWTISPATRGPRCAT